MSRRQAWVRRQWACWCSTPLQGNRSLRGGASEEELPPSCHSQKFLPPAPDPLPCAWFLWLASRGRVGWGRAGLEISQTVGMGLPPLPRDSTLPCKGQSHFSVSCQLRGEPSNLLWNPNASQTWLGSGLAKASFPVASALQSPASPHTARSYLGAKPHPPSPVQMHVAMPSLTTAVSRLCRHDCHHCCQGPQQL